MKRFLALMLALAVCLACFASCGTTDKNTQPEQNHENPQGEDGPTYGSGSKTVKEGDFEITLSADNTVFSLKDIENGNITSFDYKVKIKYVGDDTFVLARRASFASYDVFGTDGSAPFGSTDSINIFTNVQIQPGFETEETFTGSYYLSQMDEANEYVVRCSVYFSTLAEHFSEQYQNGEQTCHPSDEQLKQPGKDYRISVEMPLTIVE